MDAHMRAPSPLGRPATTMPGRRPSPMGLRPLTPLGPTRPPSPSEMRPLSPQGYPGLQRRPSFGMMQGGPSRPQLPAYGGNTRAPSPQPFGNASRPRTPLAYKFPERPQSSLGRINGGTWTAPDYAYPCSGADAPDPNCRTSILKHAIPRLRDMPSELQAAYSQLLFCLEEIAKAMPVRDRAVQATKVFAQIFYNLCSGFVPVAKKLRQNLAEVREIVEDVWRQCGGLMSINMEGGYAAALDKSDPEGGKLNSVPGFEVLKIVPQGTVQRTWQKCETNARHWAEVREAHFQTTRRLLADGDEWTQSVEPIEQWNARHGRGLPVGPGPMPPKPNVRACIKTLGRCAMALDVQPREFYKVMSVITEETSKRRGVFYNETEAIELFHAYREIDKLVKESLTQMETSLKYTLSILKDCQYLAPEFSTGVNLPPHRYESILPSIEASERERRQREQDELDSLDLSNRMQAANLTNRLGNPARGLGPMGSQGVGGALRQQLVQHQGGLGARARPMSRGR